MGSAGGDHSWSGGRGELRGARCRHAGRSVDTFICGPDGAQVIETTELLIKDLSAGEPSEIVRDDSVADLGEPNGLGRVVGGRAGAFHRGVLD